MTDYLTAKRAALVARFDALPNTQDHAASFEGIAALIQWIDENPMATQEQYKAFEARVVAGPEEPRESRLDMVRERARRMA